RILLKEEVSINESYLWLVDTRTGEKSALTPRDAKEKISYGDAEFSKDGKGVYVTTDKDSEYHRLAYLDFATKQPKYLTTKIPGGVDRFEFSDGGEEIGFGNNGGGVSVLHVRNLGSETDAALPKLPTGVIGSLRWQHDGHELGFSLVNARGPGDV